MAITPRYNNERVEPKVGLASHGVSIISEKGKRKITDQSVVDVVTFSFFYFLVLKSINHRCNRMLILK